MAKRTATGGTSQTAHTEDSARPEEPARTTESAGANGIEQVVRTRLRGLRRAMGLSLDELAARTNLSASTISRIRRDGCLAGTLSSSDPQKEHRTLRLIPPPHPRAAPRWSDIKKAKVT